MNEKMQRYVSDMIPSPMLPQFSEIDIKIIILAFLHNCRLKKWKSKNNHQCKILLDSILIFKVATTLSNQLRIPLVPMDKIT